MRITMSSSRRYKAQIAFEYMFIFGIFMTAVILSMVFAYNKSMEIDRYQRQVEIESLLKTVADKIDTVWLEGEGFSSNITVPMTVTDYAYTLNMSDNYLILTVMQSDYIKPILTSNITGNFSMGGVSTLENKGSFIEITHN